MKLSLITVALLAFMLFSCQNEKKLPVLGNPKVVNGQEIPHKIPDFSFVNQNGDTITNKDYDGKIYIADFFFTTCPTICPTVMSNMVRIYDKYENTDEVKLLSHTLDPKRDSIQALRNYAENLEVKAPKWNLVTGEKSLLHGMADDYMNIVVDDPSAPGGINHSGKIILVDKEKRVRSFADGTIKEEVDRFMKDIDLLLLEYKN